MTWTHEMIEAVWQKGKIVNGNDPTNFRKDFADNWIKRDKYGIDRKIKYQWEIHHKIREAAGGSDHISNLEPLNGDANARLQ